MNKRLQRIKDEDAQFRKNMKQQNKKIIRSIILSVILFYGVLILIQFSS